MRVEFRLKPLLIEYGLDRHGVITEIAHDLGVHRHTIGRIYHNEAPTVSTEMLGELCDWLVAHGVDPGGLPQELIGPAGIPSLMQHCRRVRLYLGEYHARSPESGEYAYIAREDSMVAAAIQNRVSGDPSGPGIRTFYVPFHARDPRDPDESGRRNPQAREYVQRSEETFRDMRREREECANVIVGSQRSNPLTERFVADCFGCEPFRPPQPCKDAGRRVPFYLVYRPGQPRPSCFGGDRPPGWRGTAEAGIWYLDSDDRWVLLPWRRGEASAGVVVVLREPASQSLELALFGYSGQATYNLGHHLLERPEAYWPPQLDLGARQLGVFVCAFDEVDEPEGPGSPNLVIPLAEQTLKKYASARAGEALEQPLS